MDSNQDKAARSNWAKEWQNLRIKFRMANRTKYQPLLSIRPEGKVIVEQLEKQEKRHEQEQEQEISKLFAVINGLRKETRELKELIATVTKVTGEQKLVTLQKKTTDIEAGLKQFKLNSRDKYEELAKEELELMKDMEIYEEKFDAWEKEKAERIPKKEIKARVRTAAIGRRNLNAEENSEDSGPAAIKKQLENIDKEIDAMGGVYLGWSRSDHDDYLKLRTKHKGKVKTLAFVNEVAKLIPDISAEDISIHSQNYDLYLKLCGKKKELLQKYKELKKLESNQEDEEVMPEKENEPRKPQVQSKEELKKQKEKVTEWKKKREEELKQKTEAEQQQKREREREKQLRTELEKQKKKILVEEYKQKKEIEAMMRKEQELSKACARKKLSPEELLKLQEREQATFQKRVDKLQYKKYQKLDRIEKQQKAIQALQENFKHVPSKLNVETTAQLSKKRTKFDGKGRDALTFGGDLLHIQSRAVPNWRAGL
eukprot:TRINITY_DN1697_c0_g1_i10.p1 TRINITY_DN1697_c0_g1~~TRINITY_DN1697_c0_g1_i10.p1  ORF type:complete len:485 (+),score=195.62 TRINITY_DN1697_c0_g1_i10:828-2282(+)